MKLIVRQTGTIFDFCESTNGTDYDGIIYGGNSVKLAYTNDTLTVSVDSGENKQYPLSDLNYDDGNEIIGFATMLEFVTALKTAGFTGNFNSGGGSPQPYAILKITQSGTNAPIITELVNNYGASFNSNYNSNGSYTITYSDGDLLFNDFVLFTDNNLLDNNQTSLKLTNIFKLEDSSNVDINTGILDLSNQVQTKNNDILNATLHIFRK